MAMNQKLLRPKKPAAPAGGGNSLLTESGNTITTESGNKIVKE